MELLSSIFYGIWSTLLAMAPWLLFGFFAAGLLSLAFSPERVSAHLGKQAGMKAIFLSVLFGVPLPLCSCGVLPAAVGLRKSGASKGATAAFLISTPQTGLDSFFATGSLLGWAFALMRPLVATVTGLLGGVLVDRSDNEPAPEAVTAKSISSTKHGFFAKLFAALTYGYGLLLGNVTGPLIVGILLSALITVFVPEQCFGAYALGNDWVAFPVMLLIGIPMYVCSTASIPVALSLMAKGMSPGAALIYLIVGPALNGASVTMLIRLLGKRCMMIHLGVIASMAIIAGATLNALDRLWQILPDYSALQATCQGCTETSWLSVCAALALIALLLYHSLRKFIERFTTPMTTTTGTTVTIKGMTCDHCRGAAQRLLASYPSVTSVEQASPESFIVQGTLPESLAKDIKDLGFTLVETP